MTVQTIILIGAPDSGKTNYLARLWKSLRDGRGRLKSVDAPNIQYVEEALAHLLQGSFAPRSNPTVDESKHDFALTVAPQDDSKRLAIAVPDITGELWKKAVSSSELPAEWMALLRESTGAILFVRVHSGSNVAPLDWVLARDLMKTGLADGQQEDAIPTQVMLCELLRFLQHTLRKNEHGGVPRVAIVITAWDLLDDDVRQAGPSAYLESEFPLFAGKLDAVENLGVKLFGVSIVGGDLGQDEAFRTRFFETDLDEAGYVVEEIDGAVYERHDLTLPLAWLADS